MPTTKSLAYVAFLLPALLFSTSTVSIYLPKHDAQHRPSENPQLDQRALLCPGFDGNSDFYGLGIRLGVYLQWLASWLTNTLSPNEAGPSHDANSIFVLAIVIAIITSIATDRIKPVEVYVMLLICFGFFFTVLSFLGIRLYFLKPASITNTIKRLKRWCVSWYTSRKGRSKRILQSVKNIMAPTSGVGMIGDLKIALSAMKMFVLGASFTSASSVKHHAVSWSGVVWRTTIASMVASINIYLWWSPWRLHQNAASPTHCDALVFFFGRQEMSPTMITFFKVASIMLAAPIFYLFLVLYQVLGAMIQLSYEIVLHRIFGSTFRDSRIFRSWNRLPESVRKYILGMSFSPASSLGISPFLDILGAYLESDKREHAGTPLHQGPPEEHESPPSLDNLVKAYIGFLSRGTEETGGDASHNSQAGSVHQSLCFVTHAVLLATMACFILFVELTLTANSISGVYTLQTTGQLIPFIIGIASLAAAIREIALRYVRNQHPNYNLVSLTVDVTAGTGRIEMRQNGSNRSAPAAVHGMQTATVQRHQPQSSLQG